MSAHLSTHSIQSQTMRLREPSRMMAMTPGGLWWSTQVKPIRKKHRPKGRAAKLKSLSVSTSTPSLPAQSSLASASVVAFGGAPPPPKADKSGPIGIHSACRMGNLARVRALVEAGADLSVRDAAMDETPLHCAARRCNIQIVRLLINAGADCAARTPSDRLASDLVQPPHRYSMVRELLQTTEDDILTAQHAAKAAQRRLKKVGGKYVEPAKDNSYGLSTHVNSHQAESCWVLTGSGSVSTDAGSLPHHPLGQATSACIWQP